MSSGRESGDQPTLLPELARAFLRSPELLAVLSVEGRLIRINPRWSAVLGYSEADLLDSPIAELVHPEDREHLTAALGVLVAGGAVVRVELRCRAKSAEFVRLAWSLALDASAGLVHASAHDVTADHRARCELESHAELLDLAPTPMFAREPNGRITAWNRAAEAEYGWSAEEAIGASAFELLATELPAPREAVDAELEASGRWEGEVRVRARDGRAIVAACRARLRRSALGRTAVVLEVHDDVTSRREVERLKSEFVSTVSHELRTPLTSIRGSLRLLASGVAGPLGGEVEELVGLALSNTERLIRLVNELLDLEKIEAGKLELHPADVEARAIVEEAVGPLRGLAEQSGIALELRAPEGFVVRADEDRILQVLTNLLSNALKFSPRGSTVTICVDRGARPGRVRFSVRDQGPGIPPEKLSKLFGKFQQLDASDARAKGGTGLGLAISKAIIEQHRGEIGVDSVPGRGSTFWFDLGLSGEPAAQLLAVGTDEQRHTVILVVDRETADLADLRALLAREGCEVVRARSHEEAERLLDGGAPRALVVDLGDPAPERVSRLSALRARAGARSVPMIVLGPPAGEPAFVASFVDWMPKPIDGRRLSRALRRATRGQGAPKVLVIDDDRSTRRVLQSLLRPLAIECVEAEDGVEGIQLARLHQPDLIVLDVAMPRADGFDVVDVLRLERARSTPLLVYSERELDAAERDALRLGATRWLTKARASEEELVDAVRTLLHDVAEPFDAGPTDAFLVPPLR